MFKTLSLSTLLESLLLPILLVLMGLFINPEDPLFLHASFPWAWFIPLLVALRYGLLHASFSVGIYLIAMMYTIHHHFYEWQSYQVWLLGGVSLILICSEYQAYWRRKQRKLNLKTEYMDTRLESLSRAYSTMRISHDRLEHALIVKPVTLRGVLTELRHYIAKNGCTLDDFSAKQLLTILANCAYIEKANLYTVGQHQLNTTPIGSIGPSQPLNLDNILVKKCLKERETTYFAVNSLKDHEHSEYMAVIPMETADHELLGILTISELPFLSMTEESLRIISLLLAYVADDIYAATQAKIICQRFPDCPVFFASEIIKLKHLYRIAKINSLLFTYHFKNNAQGIELMSHVRQEVRGLDVIWERKFPEHLELWLLMPLTSTFQIDSYINRIDKSLHHAFDLGLHNGVIQYHFQLISKYQNLDELMGAFQTDAHH